MGGYDEYDLGEAIDGAIIDERERIGEEIMQLLVDASRVMINADPNFQAGFRAALGKAAAIVSDETGVRNLLPDVAATSSQDQ